MTRPPDPLARFARVTPPRDHVRRVLERTGSGPVNEQRRRPGDERAGNRHVLMPVRWLAASVAGLVVIAGLLLVYQVRDMRDIGLVPPAAAGEWGGKGVDVPVLPPRAYWEMSAFEEFTRLEASRTAATRRETSSARAAAEPRGTAQRSSAEGLPVNGPPQDGIAPIAIAAIDMGDIDVTPIGPLPAIAVGDIDVPELTVTPLSEEVQ